MLPLTCVQPSRRALPITAGQPETGSQLTEFLTVGTSPVLNQIKLRTVFPLPRLVASPAPLMTADLAGQGVAPEFGPSSVAQLPLPSPSLAPPPQNTKDPDASPELRRKLILKKTRYATSLEHLVVDGRTFSQSDFDGMVI